MSMAGALTARAMAAIRWRAQRLAGCARRTPFYVRYPEYLFNPRAPRTDEAHLRAAMEWLCRAQDVTGGGGVSAYFNMRKRQWAGPYRETTGYIIPTFLVYHRLSGDQDFRDRAVAMGEWEVAAQLPSGAVCEPKNDGTCQPTPGTLPDGIKVFNTGQVVLGLCALYDETRNDVFLRSACKAADWLVSVQDPDGGWSQFSNHGANGIDSRVAWALLEVFSRTQQGSYREAAVRKVEWVLKQQRPNGWFSRSSLWDPERPWTHAIAYTISGLLESIRFLPELNDRLMESVDRSSNALLQCLDRALHSNEFCLLPCSFDQHWESKDWHSCLTGNAQIAIIWYRLAAMTGRQTLRDSADVLVNQVKGTQILHTLDPNVRGGVAGSYPVDVGYCCSRLVNWAAKFYADAIMLRQAASGRLLG